MNLSYIRLEHLFNNKFDIINYTMGKNNLQGKLILLKIEKRISLSLY